MTKPSGYGSCRFKCQCLPTFVTETTSSLMAEINALAEHYTACALYFYSWCAGRCFLAERDRSREAESWENQATLELIKRGHRLIQRDEVRSFVKVSGVTLVGSAPDVQVFYGA